MKRILFLAILFLTFAGLFSHAEAQSEEDFEKKGLKHFDSAVFKAIPQKNKVRADAEFALAEIAFQKAIEKNPNRVSAYLHLGRTYSAQKKYAAAAETDEQHRIAGKAVGAALQDDDFRVALFDEPLHAGPDLEKQFVSGARRQRDIDLGAGRITSSCFIDIPAARIEEVSVFMQIRDPQIRVVLKGIEDTVPMVSVNIDIGQPAHAMAFSQGLDRNAAIVEDTKPRGSVAACMV